MIAIFKCTGKDDIGCGNRSMRVYRDGDGEIFIVCTKCGFTEYCNEDKKLGIINVHQLNKEIKESKS